MRNQNNRESEREEETLNFFQSGNREETVFQATMTLEEALEELRRLVSETNQPWRANNERCSLTEEPEFIRSLRRGLS